MIKTTLVKIPKLPKSYLAIHWYNQSNITNHGTTGTFSAMKVIYVKGHNTAQTFFSIAVINNSINYIFRCHGLEIFRIFFFVAMGILI